jgi:hypothetical protein
LIDEPSKKSEYISERVIGAVNDSTVSPE